MDVIDALASSYRHAVEVIANVRPDQMSLRSPCVGWDVRRVLDHLLRATWMFTMVNRGEPSGEHVGDIVGDDPAAAVSQAGAANLASWRESDALEGDRTYSFGTFPAPVAAVLNLTEVVVHTWDVCRATGQDAALDGAVAELLYESLLDVSLGPSREQGYFGPTVAVAPTASIADRLLGLLGRSP